MNRSFHIWIAFTICLAVVLFAMGWISRTAVRLEREQQLAEQRAALEENVRLALWRMDSTLLPIIGQESARPYEAYRSFVPTSQALTTTYSQVKSPVLLPSPLLSGTSPLIVCYFQFDSKGTLSSPQVPLGKINKVVRDNVDLSEERLSDANQNLEALARFTEFDHLAKALPIANTVTSIPQVTNGVKVQQIEQHEILPNGFPNPNTAETPSQSKAVPNQQQQSGIFNNRRNSITVQQELATNEYRQRAMKSGQAGNALMSNLGLQLDESDLRVAALQPLWIGDKLLFARRVSVDGTELIQGAWLNWPQIRKSLLNDVRDLLPEAELEPIRSKSLEDQSRMLTTIPAQLVPGPVPEELAAGWSPIRSSLTVAWICTLTAAVLGALLLAGVLSLSERRAAFVSAVTHELRTPLTTFQLYTEMLDEGLVSDEKQRGEYLKTLRTESNRLGHLVENVLAYARIDRARQPIHVEDIHLSDLINRVTTSLQQRADRGGMKLSVSRLDQKEQTAVRVDPSGVERILLNLVDNACKYASAADNRAIEMSCRIQAKKVELRIRDFGPGAQPQERQRLFRLFAKSARDAAGTKPGVGLGLALSRALARKQGGDLSIDTSITDGACFVLSLPRAD